MRKTKLTSLLNDESFGMDANSQETGFVISQGGYLFTFLVLEYDGYFHMYLSYCDDDIEDLDVLAEGIAQNLEDAKNIALENMFSMIY